MLSSTAAVWASHILCAVAATVEGLCAGNNIHGFFNTVRFPRYSAPLWVWSIIGAGYYATFGFVVVRLLSAAVSEPLTVVTVTLVTVMMFANALMNIVIFRARSLRLSNLIGCVFSAPDLLLLVCLLRLDTVAAVALAPYLVYRVYAIWWGHALMKLNPSRR